MAGDGIDAASGVVIRGRLNEAVVGLSRSVLVEHIGI